MPIPLNFGIPENPHALPFLNRIQYSHSVAISVLSVFDLMKTGEFVRFQDCRHLRHPSSTSIVLMVSHRWEDTLRPDPQGIQYHGAVRFAIQACMMAMGSTPNVFNCVDSSEVILSTKLFEKLRKLHERWLAAVKSSTAIDGDLDLTIAQRTWATEDLFHKCQQLLEYLTRTIGEENTRIVALDIACLAYMMDHVAIWYDYTCLPQIPRTDAEEDYFNEQLRNLHRYFAANDTAIIWSKTALRRAWCFLEAMISLMHGTQSVFSCENSLISSTEPSKIYQMFFTVESVSLRETGEVDELIRLEEIDDTFRQRLKAQNINEEAILKQLGRVKANNNRVDLTRELTRPLKDMLVDADRELRRKRESEITCYLRDNGFECTVASDIGLVAQILGAHYRES